MANKFGSVPLSSDILTKANIGLWAFELDEGQPPRMYADEAMLGLLGLKEQKPPEEIYHAWYDHIDKDSYGLVHDAVEKMMVAHAEVQYPWHYSDGRTIIVRCGGVRNPAYTKGIRIEGTHQNVTEVLHYEEAKLAEQRKQFKESLELAKQQRYMKSFGDMVNAALWSIAINSANEVIGVKWSDEVRNMLGLTAEEYPDKLEAWLERLHEDDKDRIMEAFYKGLNTSDTKNYVYDLEYRLRKKSGEYCWYHALGRMEYNDDGTRVLYGIIYDMTADKQLAEQQEQLKEALAIASYEAKRNDVLTEIISGTRFTFDISTDDEVVGAHYSEAAEARLGEEYAKTPTGWLELLYPEDKQRVYEAFMATVRDHTGQTAFDAIFRMMGISGKYRWVRSGGNVIRRPDGSGEFFGISLDMTNQMEEQQQRLLGAVPISPDILAKEDIGMWAFELDEGKPPRMYGDEAMLRLVGLEHQVPPEEMYHAWYDHIDEGSYGLVHDAVDKMMNGEHAEVQYPWHHPDGRTMIVRCGGVRNPEYKKGIRVEGTHQNVTVVLHFDEERMRNLERQKIELVKSRLRADALAFVSDHEPDIAKFIEFFGNRILEIAKCDQVIFRNLKGHRMVFNAPGVKDIPQEICSACPFAQFDSDLYSEGFVLMNDCGKGCKGVMTHPSCPAKSSFMQRLYSAGKLVGLMTVHYLNEHHTFSDDIIDIMKTVAIYFGLLRERIEAKRIEREKIKAESSNKAKTEFLFSMSHDIRTPMNAILGYTNIGLRNVENIRKARDSFKKIKTAGEHLLKLINDILEMSRIESGHLEFNEKPLDIRNAVFAVEQMSRALAVPKSIDFDVVMRRLEHPYIYADEVLVDKIIINLISNAIKYTEEGGKVRYSIEELGDIVDGKATYRFEVSDTGIGMSEEFQRHIFEAFAREATSTVSRQEGVGLGLSIVKKIVDAAGGTIRIRSKRNEGSTFSVEIPFRVMDEEAIHACGAESKPSNDIIKENVILEGKKVLLVEDNEMNREIALEILAEVGLVVDTAEDGDIAVDTIEEKGTDYYDFVLMDIQMPAMDGYEATKLIRNLPGGAALPIIAVSANAFDEDIIKSLEAGMDAHIAKPIDVHILLETMRRMVIQ